MNGRLDYKITIQVSEYIIALAAFVMLVKEILKILGFDELDNFTQLLLAVVVFLILLLLRYRYKESTLDTL